MRRFWILLFLFRNFLVGFFSCHTIPSINTGVRNVEQLKQSPAEVFGYKYFVE